MQRKELVVDGLVTSYLEAGDGDPVILLHGGEFGVSAEIGWERTIPALAERYRVLAPDMLGFGQSAKVVDFNDGRGMRIRHIARFCDELGVDSAHFVGNSMGAINLLTDATSESPVLPMRSLVAICGGGDIQRNQYMEALYDYDATVPAMRRIVEALFHDPSYPADDDYVQRRYESSIAPGAWEALAAARFRRPGAAPPPAPSSKRAYERVSVPALVVEGGCDKLLPPGWAKEIADQISGGRSAVVEAAGHCPQGDVGNAHHRQHQHPGRQGKAPIKVHDECQIANIAKHNGRNTGQHLVSTAQDGVRSAGGEFGQIDPSQHAHGATHQHDPDTQDRGAHDGVAQAATAAMRVLDKHAPMEHGHSTADDSDQHPQRRSDHHRQTAEACGPPQRVDDLASSNDRPMPSGRRCLPGPRRSRFAHFNRAVGSRQRAVAGIPLDKDQRRRIAIKRLATVATK